METSPGHWAFVTRSALRYNRPKVLPGAAQDAAGSLLGSSPTSAKAMKQRHARAAAYPAHPGASAHVGLGVAFPSAGRKTVCGRPHSPSPWSRLFARVWNTTGKKEAPYATGLCCLWRGKQVRKSPSRQDVPRSGQGGVRLCDRGPWPDPPPVRRAGGRLRGVLLLRSLRPPADGRYHDPGLSRPLPCRATASKAAAPREAYASRRRGRRLPRATWTSASPTASRP